MKSKKSTSLTFASAVVAAFAPLLIAQAPAAHAGPLCPPVPANAWGPYLARLQQIHEQCLQAEKNQAYCGDGRGCTPGDPCTVGSPIERAECTDARLSGQQPHF